MRSGIGSPVMHMSDSAPPSSHRQTRESAIADVEPRMLMLAEGNDCIAHPRQMASSRLLGRNVAMASSLRTDASQLWQHLVHKTI